MCFNLNLWKIVNEYILISNYGTEDLEWEIEHVGLNYDAAEWFRVSKNKGTIESEQMTIVTVTYKTQKVRPKYYQAFIKIYSNDRKLKSIEIPIELRVFSESLINSGSKYELKIKNERFFESRPKYWELPALPPKNSLIEKKLYLEAILEFSQPIASLDASELIIMDGDLEMMSLWQDELRSQYLIHVSKSIDEDEDDLWQSSHFNNEFCIMVMENTIFNIYNKPFQNQTICTRPKIRPKSRFYGTFLTFMSDVLVTTNKFGTTLILAFSEPVIGFNASNIKINGNAVLRHIKPVNQMKTLFFVELEFRGSKKGLGEKIELTLIEVGRIKCKDNGVPMKGPNGAQIVFYKMDELPLIHNSFYYVN